MDIVKKYIERRSILFTLLAILVIGISLIFSMFQAFNRQKEASQEYLLLTAKSVLQAVESSLRRGFFIKKDGEELISPRAADFFYELSQNSDVLFVNVFDPHNFSFVSKTDRARTYDNLINSISDPELSIGFLLNYAPKISSNKLFNIAFIQFPVFSFDNFEIMQNAIPEKSPAFIPLLISPSSSTLQSELFTKNSTSFEINSMGLQYIWEIEGVFEIEKIKRYSQGPLILPKGALQALEENKEWFGEAWFKNNQAFVYAKLINLGYKYTKEKEDQDIFLLVGLDMSKNSSISEQFNRNLLYQIMYIIIAAIVFWILGISFLKRKELASKAVELEHFQTKLLDNLPDGLLLIDSNGKIEGANPAVKKILKYETEDLVGKNISELSTELSQCLIQSNNLVTDHLDQFIINGVFLEVLTLPLKQENEHKQLRIIRDRTEIKELEKSLVEAEKLAALGTLAAGVAHEIRNPLSALRGFAQYFAKKFSGKNPEEKYAQIMVVEADRLNRVITDLLYLSRQRQLNLKQIDLEKILKDIELLISFDLNSKNVSLIKELNVKTIIADEDCLQQALLNILLNSLEAMQANNLINQDVYVMDNNNNNLGNDTQKPLKINIKATETENFICLSIQDFGIGMSEGVKDQAFEPFFTKKSKGTGLGLALVHKIMREHGGKIKLESIKEQGTTVFLYFPNHFETES